MFNEPTSLIITSIDGEGLCCGWRCKEAAEEVCMASPVLRLYV